MNIIGEDEIKELEKFFKEIKEKVSFDVYIDKEKNPETSEIILNLFNQLKQNFKEKFDYVLKENVDELGININEINKKGPVITPSNKKNIIFLGIPAGHEFPVLLEVIYNLSNNYSAVPPELQEKIKKIEKEIEILVFTTPECPYCPPMSSLAHNMAFLNDKIKGIIIESLEFPELTNKFNVQGVPKLIVRDAKTKEILVEQEGMQHPTAVVENIIKNI